MDQNTANLMVSQMLGSAAVGALLLAALAAAVRGLALLVHTVR